MASRIRQYTRTGRTGIAVVLVVYALLAAAFCVLVFTAKKGARWAFILAVVIYALVLLW